MNERISSLLMFPSQWTMQSPRRIHRRHEVNNGSFLVRPPLGNLQKHPAFLPPSPCPPYPRQGRSGVVTTGIYWLVILLFMRPHARPLCGSLVRGHSEKAPEAGGVVTAPEYSLRAVFSAKCGGRKNMQHTGQWPGRRQAGGVCY